MSIEDKMIGIVMYLPRERHLSQHVLRDLRCLCVAKQLPTNPSRFLRICRRRANHTIRQQQGLMTNPPCGW